MAERSAKPTPTELVHIGRAHSSDLELTAGVWLPSTAAMVVCRAVLWYAVRRLPRRHEPPITRK